MLRGCPVPVVAAKQACVNIRHPTCVKLENYMAISTRQSDRFIPSSASSDVTFAARYAWRDCDIAAKRSSA
jgi:hypothetical protein